MRFKADMERMSHDFWIIFSFFFVLLSGEYRMWIAGADALGGDELSRTRGSSLASVISVIHVRTKGEWVNKSINSNWEQSTNFVCKQPTVCKQLWLFTHCWYTNVAINSYIKYDKYNNNNNDNNTSNNMLQQYVIKNDIIKVTNNYRRLQQEYKYPRMYQQTLTITMIL